MNGAHRAESKAMASDVLQRLADQHAMIEQLASDSRRCAPGTAFFAYPGEAADGRRYIADALARGASAVRLGVRGLHLGCALAGAERRRIRPQAAGRVDCACFLWSALGIALGLRRHRHQRQDVVHAMDRRRARCTRDAERRDRDAREWLSRCAAAVRRTRRRTCSNCMHCSREMKRAGARAVAMEASSHGLAQGRTNGSGVRLRVVHQSIARPSRLPRFDGCLRRSEGAAVRGTDSCGGGPESRRRGRRAACRARARAGTAHHRLQPDGVGPRTRNRRPTGGRAQHRVRGRSDACAASRRAGATRTSCCRSSDASTCERARRARLPARLRRRIRRGDRTPRRAAAGRRAHAGAGRRRRTARHRRLCAHAGCAGQGAARAASGGRCARWCAGCGIRCRRRSRPGQAPDDGRGRGDALPTAWS